MDKLVVGIQGTHGSYHEQVAQNYFGEDASITYLHTFKDVFIALESEEITHAVVAIANNRYGFVPNAFSEFMRRTDKISIVGEDYLAVRHQLLALPGATLETITEVHSQPAAIGQCNTFLSKTLPDAELIEEDDTARSAELVSKSGQLQKAAIASKKAGELYGLVPVAENIQDDTENTTRFLIVQKASLRTIPMENGNKTTALLKTSQKPGSLVDALLPFKEQEVNISTLHSSFLPNTSFEMQFFIEFDANMSDISMKKVSAQLGTVGADLTVLGSYTSKPPNL